MKKVLIVVGLFLLIISFGCNALIGDTHRAKYDTTSLRILPNEIILDGSLIYAIVETADYKGVVKSIYVYNSKECLTGVGTLKELSMDKPMRLISTTTVFISGATLGEAIVNDMCIWAVKQ